MSSFELTADSDKLTGTAGSDDFFVNSSTDLTADDKINGAGGYDYIDLATGIVASDSQFKGVRSVEEIDMAPDSTSLILEIGANATAAGIARVSAYSYSGSISTGALTVDASTYGKNFLAIDASTGTNDLKGSAFDDRFWFLAGALGNTDKVDGGQESFASWQGDLLGLYANDLSNTKVALTDADLAQVRGIETLAIEDDTSKGNASFDVTLGANSDAAGITEVYAHYTFGATTIDASGRNDAIAISAGSGNNTLTGTGRDDIFYFYLDGTPSSVLDWNDIVDGGNQTFDDWRGDVLELDGDGKTTLVAPDVIFTGVKNIETLQFWGAPSVNAELGTASEKAGISLVEALDMTGTFRADASQRTDGLKFDSGAGVNVLTGTASRDLFYFSSKNFNSADKVDGGGAGAGDNDRISIYDKPMIADAAFTNVKSVEGLVLNPSHPLADPLGAKVVAGLLSEKAGIVWVENDTDYAVTVDASARSTGLEYDADIGDDIFVASKGADYFDAWYGDDSFRVKLADLDSDDIYLGGGGTDEVRILDSQDVKSPADTIIIDSDFKNFSSVERLVFDGSGHQEVILGTNAAASGLAIIDASKVAGGIDLEAAVMAVPALQVYAGTGADTIKLGNNKAADVYIQSSKLTSADTIDGGNGGATLHFTDAVKLTDAAFLPLIGQVTHFLTLDLDSAAAKQTAVLGDAFFKFAQAAGLTEIHATSESAATSVTFDFSGHGKGYGFNVFGSGGNDTFVGGLKGDSFLGGSGDDTFKYSSANFAHHALIEGGPGNDTILITDAGDNVAGMKIADADFGGVSTTEKLQLGASKTGFYDVTLGSTFDVSGISTVDGTLAGVKVTVDASATKHDLTILGGAKDNVLTGGDGDDVIVVDAKSFNANDKLDGGDGSDTLKFSTGGVITAAAFGGSQNIEFVQLADAKNTVTIADSLVQSSDGNADVVMDGVVFRAFDFAVLGGKGNDTVDLSQITNGHIGIVSGGGVDNFIGSAQDDVFLFTQAGELTAADKVNGGDGSDTVVALAGTYTSDQFKGFKNIETFEAFAGNPSKGSTITIKNDFVSSLTADASGQKAFQLDLAGGGMTGNDTVDASAVTGTLNAVLIAAGGGNDTLIGGAGNDVFGFSDTGSTTFELNKDDTVVGSGGFDAIRLDAVIDSAALVDADLAGVHGVEAIVVTAEGSNQASVALGENAAAAGIYEIDATGMSESFFLNASFYGFTSPTGVHVDLGSGDDSMLLSTKDDVVVVDSNTKLDANDTINGGDGIDRIEFTGSGAYDDAALKFVSHFEQISLSGAADKFTLGANAVAAGIDRVDAVQARQSVTIDASVMNNDATIIGSSFADTLKGGKGDDVIAGGSGKDTMTGGGGDDTFAFFSADDSRMGAGGDLSHVDLITDYDAGDEIGLGALQVDETLVTGTGTLVTTDTAGFFSKGGVVAQYDSKTGLTTVYVDTSKDGDFQLNKDLVFQIQGDQIGTLDISGSLLHPGALHPVLAENSAITLATAKIYTDSDPAIAGAGAGHNALVLSATKGNYSVTLGANSEADGFRFVDGSKVTGALTVNASGRSDPVYVAAGSGANDLTGTAGDDVFYFKTVVGKGPGLTAADKVNGGPDGQLLHDGSDKDAIFIIDKSVGLTDSAFSNVKNVEVLEFGPSPLPGATALDVTGQKVTLGVKSEAAGIGTIVNDYDTGLTVDASGRTYQVNFTGGSGNDVLYGSTESGISGHFSKDVFEGGAGDDSFRVTLGSFILASIDTFDGGLGTDEVRILDSFNGTNGITDFDFEAMTSVERLVFDAKGPQDVHLGSHAESAGLSIIDASKAAGGLTLDATADTKSLSVTLGAGDDHITLSGAADQNDIFMVSKDLTKDDQIDGGYTQSGSHLHFTDAVKVTDAQFAGLDVINIAQLDLDSTAKGQSFVAGANFAQWVVNNNITFLGTLGAVHATSTDANTSFTFDFSAYAGPATFSVIGSGGNDTFIAGSLAGMKYQGDAGNDVFVGGSAAATLDGGAGDDSFRFSSANFAQGSPVLGGKGTDEILLLDPITPVTAAEFQNDTSVEILRLGATKSGSYSVTLGAASDAAGIVKVDASLAGVAVTIDASAAANNLTLIGGAKSNTLTGGSGDDVLVVGTKSFTGKYDGGDAVNGDTLRLSTGGTVAAGSLATLNKIEIIQLSDAGNTLALTNAPLNTSDYNVHLTLNGGAFGTFDFAVLGGKGNDIVDLSAVDALYAIAVVGNGGVDKFTGSAGDNTFAFPLAGDFTAADVVKGGAGNDTLALGAGTYAAAAFKGLSSIENIALYDPTHGKDSAVKLDNNLFKTLDVDGDGHRTVTVSVDADQGGHTVVDASAVTNGTFVAKAEFGVGDDTFIGGAAGDWVRFHDNAGLAFELTAADKVAGGIGWDTISLQESQDGSALSDAAFAGVSSVEELDVTTIASIGVSLTLGANAQNAGIEEVHASKVGGAYMTLDASAYTQFIAVYAGGGTKDHITLGSGDDGIRFDAGTSTLDSTDTIDGGAGNDTVRFGGDTTITDDEFTHVTNMEWIDLRDGAFSVTLAGKADAAGIGNVTALHADHTITLDAHAMTHALKVSGSIADDTIETGSGDDTIIGGTGADSLTGNAGADSFKYTSAGDSVLQVFGDISHMDTIQDFNHAQGDTIDLTSFGLDAATVVHDITGTVNSLSGIAGTPYSEKGGVNVAVIGGDTYVFADTDKDGVFHLNADLMIKVVGTHATELTTGGITL